MSRVLRRSQVRGHPELSLLNFGLGRPLSEMRDDFLMLASRRIEVWLNSQSTLACVTNGDESACIYLHSVLNHPETPRRVIAFILCHELIHLIVPSRDVDGKSTAHPPEFWEAERERFPDWAMAWSWILVVLGPCLRSDRRKECTLVKRSWKCLMNGERPTLEQLSSVLDSDKTSSERTLL